MARPCRIAKTSQPPTRKAGSGWTRRSGSHRGISISYLGTPVSRLTFLQRIEVHVFYVALGYFISYLPFALLAEALSSGMTVDRAAVSLDDHHHAAAMIQRTVEKQLAERFL
jgi:hypothetical protein